MAAGCCACPPLWAAGLVSAFVLVLALGEDAHGFELAWRMPGTPGTPMSNMLTAP